MPDWWPRTEAGAIPSAKIVLQDGGMGTLSDRTAAPLPTPGCVVYCRSHNHLVEEVRPPEQAGGDTVVRMACLDDGVNGRVLEVLWEREGAGLGSQGAASSDGRPLRVVTGA